MNDHSAPQKSKILEFLGEYWLIILMLTLIVVACGFAYYVVTIYQNALQTVAPTTTDRGDWGTTGDFFGGVLNPIFAFLGLIMLLATLFQSQRELSLTRKELELSRKAAEESEKALADQALTQKQQRFENTFFALLNQYSQLSKTLDTLEGNLNKHTIHISTLEDAKTAIQSFIRKQHFIKSYLMLLHQILRFIYLNHNIEKDSFTIDSIKNYNTLSIEEQGYANLFKSLISDHLGTLILLNCIETRESNLENYPKLKALVERYSIFEHLSLTKHLDKSFLHELIQKNCYAPKAFANNSEYLLIRDLE
ncbi:MAG: putative phage abortive infection protein [Thiofilum sp.]|uniref:putative phage abortive infection protein n=1 Tax=Thiofilum sp. TaxID=2212733 RepID=UPI0025D2D54E|nr:putative phage abortive infection protein [Thiofilum sp.]MBK8452661.1 hypothetical protein [Thiofilum sp.]